ncbi:MAG TPA: glycosyltransferase [Candidatus Desulfobacillus sp.]|nr:glycosyltransferase [Candidatus Desulfobacillus sp.]
MSLPDGKVLVMLNSAGRGGMRSVVEAWQRDGLFARWNVRLLHTHVEGSLARRLLAAARALLQFAGLLLRGRVALVHAHVAMGGSFWRKALFSALARRFGVPVILHLHGSDLEIFHDARDALGRRLVRRELELAQRVLVLSGSWRGFVARVAPRARALVLANYVALPPAQACGLPHEGVNLLFLGILGRRKGIYDLLPAFREALGQAGGMRLRIGGNGEEAQVAAAIAELGLGGAAELLGWVDEAAREALLATADVFVLPSWNEGLPMGLLEAMAHGVPVVSTRVGGIPELVREGVDGFLVEPGDRAALAERLLRLARDEGLRRRMGAAARQRVAERYCAAAVLPLLEGVYAEAAGAAAPRTRPGLPRKRA